MINPELQAFLTDWAQAWSRLPQGADAAARRAHFETVAAAMRQPTPADVSTHEVHQVPVPQAMRPVRLRVFRPTAASPAPQAAMIYLHGGAFMQGSPETHWDITCGIAQRTGRVVFSVDYAKAPEQPFPAAVNDVRAVVAWLFDQATPLGVNAEAIAIGGDSAGANLAAAMTIAFRGSSRRLQAQLLVYPCCDFDTSRPSYHENADGPIVTTASMPAVNHMYCPDLADRQNPLAAPLCATSHAGLPPCYLAVAEHDPLRDSGLVYADALRAAGVPLVLDRGPGLIHGYLRAMSYCNDAQASFERMCHWLKLQSA